MSQGHIPVDINSTHIGIINFGNFQDGCIVETDNESDKEKRGLTSKSYPLDFTKSILAREGLGFGLVLTTLNH